MLLVAILAIYNKHFHSKRGHTPQNELVSFLKDLKSFDLNKIEY